MPEKAPYFFTTSIMLPSDKRRILISVYDWFDEYQWDQDHIEMEQLYVNLIGEEEKETLDALLNLDMVEYLDWIIDTFWVRAWYFFFTNARNVSHNTFIDSMYYYISNNLPENLFFMLLEEVSKSNWTKTKGKQQDWEKKWKIIKGHNFVKPDIRKVVETYKSSSL